MRQLTANGRQDVAAILEWLSGRFAPEPEVESRVAGIIADVRARGDAALAEYTRRFDCPAFQPHQLRVSAQAMAQAAAELPVSDLDIIAEAASNIRDFHQRQVQQSWWATQPNGTMLGQLVRPVDRAGMYVPGGAGGETPLISSLLMTAIPAQVAGVSEIAVVSPPRADGNLNPYLLAAAHQLGITEVYAAGSAWAIAALGHGTESIRPVDVIAGPGNIYVTIAKRLLMGQVGIDMLAGPSEIVVLADASADPAAVAADLLSQAEHDPLAAAILVTADADIAHNVQAELEQQLSTLPRREIAAKSLEHWGAVIIVPNLAAGIELVNALAPEHLELCLADPWPLLGSIRHAGAIFLGHHCPEAAGDYFAGPNHVLPTMRTARFASALSVETFTKKTSLIAASCTYVQGHADKIARMARLEGLEAHARSAEIRRGRS